MTLNLRTLLSFTLVSLAFFAGCDNSGGSSQTDKSASSSSASDKAITTFKVNGVAGVIDEKTKTINVTLNNILPDNRKALPIMVATTGKSVVDPKKENVLLNGVKQDFSNGPIKYTVTAQDGSSVVYTVAIRFTYLTNTLVCAGYENKSYYVLFDMNGKVQLWYNESPGSFSVCSQALFDSIKGSAPTTSDMYTIADFDAKSITIGNLSDPLKSTWNMNDFGFMMTNGFFSPDITLSYNNGNTPYVVFPDRNGGAVNYYIVK